MPRSGRIVIAPDASERLRHAAADLQRYLAQATGQTLDLSPTPSPGVDATFVIGHRGDNSLGDELITTGAVAPDSTPEGFALRRLDQRVAVVGADEAGAVYGVYGLLEEAYGGGFFLGDEVVPAGSMPLLPTALDLQRAPAFATRGLLPWYDFLSGPTAWNLADYRLYIDRMIRMGLNFLGLHVYSTGSVNRSGGAEPFLSFTYRGVGHDGYLDTTQTSRWGYQPMRSSAFAYGTSEVFAGEVFGADVAIQACGSLDAAARAKELLGAALDYAKQRGLNICVGFEPAAVPEEILRAVPANAKRAKRNWDGSNQEVLDLSSVVAHDILRTRLDDLLTTYPQVDAIWLWQNEDAAWTLQRPDSDTLPFDASYLCAAHTYLQERAPDVQLVISGWGAVHSLFDDLHAELPREIAFSALHHNLGTTPTDEVYGRLEGRSRWPIPWLEDDATLWHPQYHLARFRQDISRARQFGADGMIGIHWRTRVIDHVAAYFAHALWQPELDVETFYRWYGERLVGPAHGAELGARFAAIDRDHDWPGYLDDAHVGSTAWSGGHSNEAGDAFSPLPTPPDVVARFDAFTTYLTTLPAAVDHAAAARVRYHAAQAVFARAYVASQAEAVAIDRLVHMALAENRVLSPSEFALASHHLETLYGAVRDAIEAVAGVLSTTADLGVLASLNQKYVQRAIWQRIDAIRQVVADSTAVPLPDLTDHGGVARVFVPVPLDQTSAAGFGIQAIVQHARATAVALHTVPLAGGPVTQSLLLHIGRGVWQGTLRATEPVRYWIEARTADGEVLRAPTAADQTFSAIVCANG